jgi:hypothetical protein
MEIYMRMAAYSDVGFLRGVDQAYYRVHGGNMSSAVSALMDLRQRRSVAELVLDRYRDRLTDTHHLSDLVHRQLSREALWAAGRVYHRGALRQSEPGRRLLGAGPHEAEQDVEELMAFAVDCWPEVKRQPLYRTMQEGGRLGPRDVQFLLSQKGQWWLRRRLWKYRGV